jgi:hypothetical protein
MFIYIYKSAMLWCTWCSPWPLSCPDHRYSAVFGFSDPGKQKKGCVHKIEAEESKKQTGGQRDILGGNTGPVFRCVLSGNLSPTYPVLYVSI